MILRWVARVWSIAAVGLLCVFLIGEGLPPLTVKSAAFPFGVMFGLLVAWWAERVGGAIAVLSLLLFYALERFGYGRFPGGPWFILIAAPGLVFLLCSWTGAEQTKSQAAKPNVPADA